MAIPIIERVFDAIDAGRPRAIETLQELVRIPSVTGQEGPVQERVEALFRERGLTIDRWETTRDEIIPYFEHVGDQPIYDGRPNIVGQRPGSGSGRSIMLNAHVDTVDPGDPTFWTYPPYSGELVDGRIYGRGSCDMKGGLVSYLMALDAIAEAGVELAGDVAIASTVGEEDGGFGALGTILRGHRADAVLITEPTRLALVVAQGGSAVLRVTITGKSAHGAMRDEGVSAIEKFWPVFQEFQALETERNQTLDHPLYRERANKIPISFGVVRSGDWHSTVPELLVAEGRLGLLPGEDLHEFQRDVEQRIAACAAKDPWLAEHPPKLEWISGQFAPAETDPSHPFPQALIAAHQQSTGAEPPIVGVPYGADMRLFTQIGGMPCVMYGAGDVAGAHQHDEHIAVDELTTAARTIAALLLDWCGIGNVTS
jgi:acetylornithine deacetylase